MPRLNARSDARDGGVTSSDTRTRHPALKTRVSASACTHLRGNAMRWGSAIRIGQNFLVRRTRAPVPAPNPNTPPRAGPASGCPFATARRGRALRELLDDGSPRASRARARTHARAPRASTPRRRRRGGGFKRRAGADAAPVAARAPSTGREGHSPRGPATSHADDPPARDGRPTDMISVGVSALADSTAPRADIFPPRGTAPAEGARHGKLALRGPTLCACDLP
jgi:hypothetical protein